MHKATKMARLVADPLIAFGLTINPYCIHAEPSKLSSFYSWCTKVTSSLSAYSAPPSLQLVHESDVRLISIFSPIITSGLKKWLHHPATLRSRDPLTLCVETLCVRGRANLDQRGREPTAKEVYAKEYIKSDALDAPEGVELPAPHSRRMPVSDVARSMVVELDKHYDAAMEYGSDESTATTQAAFATFGRSTWLGLETPPPPPRGRRPARRDTYTAQLHEQIVTLTQESVTMRQQWDANRTRLVKLEVRQREVNARQREFEAFMAEYRARRGNGDE